MLCIYADTICCQRHRLKIMLTQQATSHMPELGSCPPSLHGSAANPLHRTFELAPVSLISLQCSWQRGIKANPAGRGSMQILQVSQACLLWLPGCRRGLNLLTFSDLFLLPLPAGGLFFAVASFPCLGCFAPRSACFGNQLSAARDQHGRVFWHAISPAIASASLSLIISHVSGWWHQNILPRRFICRVLNNRSPLHEMWSNKY